MAIQHKAFRFQLVPTAEQRRQLDRFANARRYVYNWGLARWRDYYADTGKTIPFSQLLRELTALKRCDDQRWLRQVDSQLCQQAMWDLRRAFENFFGRRSRFPTFKARKVDRQRFRIPQRVTIKGNRVYVPRIGWVRLRLSRPVDLPTKSATFKEDATGAWFVTLVGEFEAPAPAPVSSECTAVGIDLGVKTFATLSDGRRITRTATDERIARRLHRAHRALSRRRPGSRNRAKARLRLAREYRRALHRRMDELHKLTTRLVAEHDLICIEDLGVGGLARTKLAKRLHHLTLREFRRQVTYKAIWQGKTVIAVDRFFPSSKLCPRCETVKASLSVSQREWTCPVCGVRHDRDMAAAQNILREGIRVAAGRADTENACGADVGLPMGAVGDEAGIQVI